MELVFLVIIIIAVLVYFIQHFSPQAKGAAGEQLIASALQKEIRRGLDGYILNNIYLPKMDGGTSEIDILLISSKGLFVIESKNYIGYIFGDDQRKNWTVSLYAGKDWIGFKQTQKYSFYNPVWQNRGHIKALRNTIGTAYPVYSVIVFSDRGDLMNISYNPAESVILQASQLHSFFSSIRIQEPDVLSPEDMNFIYQQLIPYTNVDESERIAHIEQINAPKPISNTCPLCGGNLVLRTAKQGAHVGQQFYGCSNYPKCRYTRNL